MIMTDLISFEIHKALVHPSAPTKPKPSRCQQKSDEGTTKEDTGMREKVIEAPYLRSWCTAPLSTGTFHNYVVLCSTKKPVLMEISSQVDVSHNL